MIFGYLMTTVGYALFYWGVHHFPVVDGGERVSLIDCLGIPAVWGIIRGQPVQLNPSGLTTTPLAQIPPGTGTGIGNLGGNLKKKGKIPSGTGTGIGNLGGTAKQKGPLPKPKPPTNCWDEVKLPNFGGWAWKNRQTGKIAFGVSPPGPECKQVVTE